MQASIPFSELSLFTITKHEQSLKDKTLEYALKEALKFSFSRIPTHTHKKNLTAADITPYQYYLKVNMIFYMIQNDIDNITLMLSSCGLQRSFRSFLDQINNWYYKEAKLGEDEDLISELVESYELLFELKEYYLLYFSKPIFTPQFQFYNSKGQIVKIF